MPSWKNGIQTPVPESLRTVPNTVVSFNKPRHRAPLNNGLVAIRDKRLGEKPMPGRHEAMCRCKNSQAEGRHIFNWSSFSDCVFTR